MGSQEPARVLWSSNVREGTFDIVNLVRTKFLAAARCLAVAGLLAGIGSISSLAAIYTLNLNGIVDSARTSSFTTSGSYPERHDQWYLDVYGLPSTLVRAGDVINATVTLDQSMTLTAPPSATSLSFGLRLNSSAFYPELNVGTTTTVEFLNQGVSVFSSPGPTTSGTVSAIPCSMLLYPPDEVSFTFNQVRFHTSVYSATWPVTVNTGYLQYDIATPVPEPGCLALAAIALGAWICRRKF